MIKGHLVFHSETGTEGGYYAIQDDRYTHTADQPCWDENDKHCPARHPEWWPEGTRPQHASYEGLIILRTGDWLKVLDPADGHPIFDEVLSFRDVDSYGPEGGVEGLRVHHHIENMADEERLWLMWFLAELPCELERVRDAV